MNEEMKNVMEAAVEEAVGNNECIRFGFGKAALITTGVTALCVAAYVGVKKLHGKIKSKKEVVVCPPNEENNEETTEENN